jgi:F-type H+-transporting ATPase subunit a
MTAATSTKSETKRWRWGTARWFALLFILLGIVGAVFFPPIRPGIELSAEVLGKPLVTLPVVGSIGLTNTLVATLLVDLLLIGLVIAVQRAVKDEDSVPGGIAGAVEAVLDLLYQIAESTAGKWARAIFPYMATTVLVVLLANWMELIPFVDSFGRVVPVGAGQTGYLVRSFGPIEALVKTESGTASGVRYALVPYVRVASTDLNFTIALALVVMTMVQVTGFRSQGFRYLTKFFQFRNLFRKPFLGLIDVFVGFLELLQEFFRVISFSFRLFGNLFAGSVLLIVIGSLVPVAAQSGLLLFELLIGFIQALVFGMLTLIFMSMATSRHGSDA